jgi:hypothetical protein
MFTLIGVFIDVCIIIALVIAVIACFIVLPIYLIGTICGSVADHIWKRDEDKIIDVKYEEED